MYRDPSVIYVGGPFEAEVLFTRELDRTERKRVTACLYDYELMLGFAFPELHIVIDATMNEPGMCELDSFLSHMTALTFRVCANDPSLPI
jgi:hypothetical protein